MKNLKDNLLCTGIIILFLFSSGCTEKGQNGITNSSNTSSPNTSVPQGDHPPVAMISMFPEEPRDVQKIIFKNESTDPDNENLRFEWYVDGEYDCACFSISEKFPEGEHTVKLIAKDPKGNEDEYELTFYVSETFVNEDVSELVLRREDIGAIWDLVTDEYLGENSYHTVLTNGENRIECTVEKYETVETAENKFKEYFIKPFPYFAIGNESTYEMGDECIIIFRYGNLVCKISANAILDTVLVYAKSLEAKLNQVS
ncbi:MAG: hypothetical protein KAT49_03160 [Methanomicrobia archaeon]|nr:hypothetical protein [Methanomicrobia archaeon]